MAIEQVLTVTALADRTHIFLPIYFEFQSPFKN
jgi:hypothetical protein